MKKFIIRGFLFLGLITLINIPLAFRYQSSLNNTLDYELYQIYKEQKDHLDYVFVGGSHALDGINDSLVDASLNLGSHGLTFEEEFFILKHLVKDSIQNIGIVVSAHHFFRTNRKPVKTEIFYNSPWIDLNFLERYMQDNSKLSKIFFKPRLKKYHCKSNQLECFREHLNHVGHFINYNAPYGMDYYEKILSLIQDNKQSNFYFLFLPMTPMYNHLSQASVHYKKCKQKLIQDSKRLKIPVIDLQNAFEDHKNPYRYFKDTNHLNELGSDTLTPLLMSRIQKIKSLKRVAIDRIYTE